MNKKDQKPKNKYSGVLGVLMTEFEGGLGSGTFAMAKTVGRAYWHFYNHIKLFFVLVWPWLLLSVVADFLLQSPYSCFPSFKTARDLTEIFYICAKNQTNYTLSSIVDFFLCAGFWVAWQNIVYLKLPTNGNFYCRYGWHELKITLLIIALGATLLTPNIAFYLFAVSQETLAGNKFLLYAAYAGLAIFALMPFIAARLSIILPARVAKLAFSVKQGWKVTRGATVKMLIGYIFAMGPLFFVFGLGDEDVGGIVFALGLPGVVLMAGIFKLFLFAQVAVSCSYICCAFLSLVDAEKLPPEQDSTDD